LLFCSPREENPQLVTEKHFHARFSANICCGIFRNILTGRFELEDGLAGESYRHFLKEEVLQLLENVPLEVRRQMWLQQDGLPTYFGGNALLSQQFRDFWIDRGSPVA
jgi:hypothetical protein